jgi:hypothetical protein
MTTAPTDSAITKTADAVGIRSTALLAVSVLFARRDSIYKTMPGVDVWDADRDALNWRGGNSIVAHPPCRAWGRLRHFARPRPGERELALWAVKMVQRWGGVLEHPAASRLWPTAGLPKPGERDHLGGWTMSVSQWWWGHRADKPTLLYIVGCEPSQVPPIPFRLGEASHVIQSRKRVGCRPHVSKSEREATPPALAAWLVELARICSANIRDDRQLPGHTTQPQHQPPTG